MKYKKNTRKDSIKKASISDFKLREDLPSKAEIRQFTIETAGMLFPQIEDVRAKQDRSSQLKSMLVKVLLMLKGEISHEPEVIADLFFSKLPDIKNKLIFDASFIAENDPASYSIEEVIMTYPGFFAIMVYRMANILAREAVPLVPRIMTEYAHSVTGIDIHPKATIGSPFFIDHGTGIVIGETAIIGKEVKIYQGVTIGALSVSKSQSGLKRHPTIEDNVIIYAGSTLLGGETVIGHNSIIGGNVWLTGSVPPYSLVYHQNVMKIRERSDIEADKNAF